MNPWQRLRFEARLWLTALEFLTRIPIPATAHFDPAWMSRCVRYFPWVGVLIGACGALVWWALQPMLSPWLAGALAFTATALITGAFHEDGLSDYVDGIGGGQTREQTLTIMKDSRVGSFGALALILVTLIKIAALTNLPIIDGVIALVFAHTTARACAVTVMAALPYARDDATSKVKPVAMGVTWAEVVVAWLPTVALIAFTATLATACGLRSFTAFALLAAMLSAGIITTLLALQMKRRLGGYTGDALGAAEQCAEAVILVVCAAGLSVRAHGL
jgi:adenosylcobinamide-GDP ribazoletransferase